MIPFSISTIAPVLNANHIGQDVVVQSIITDSRNVSINSLFIALQGKLFDAHDFAEQAIASGAIALLVNYQLQLDVPQLVVADTYRALGLLGAWVRQQVSTRVVALTGSSGKTSVKEMTAAILSQRGRVLATLDNFNNHIGVPLTLLRLTPKDDFAVIELGANHPGEIAWTTRLVKPETVLVNNISAAHLEGFGSLAGVAKAKGEIFYGLSAHSKVILNADSHDWPQWQDMLSLQSIWRFSLQITDCIDFFASDIQSNQYGVRFTLHSPQGICLVHLNLLGQHNVANALAASALALSVGVDLAAVVEGLAQFKALPGRLFPIYLGLDQVLLDDSYNANIGSMAAAIQVLADMPGYRVFVVGDMGELGNESVKYHRQVGEIVTKSNIDKVLSIGRLSRLIGEISGCYEHFQEQSALLYRLIHLLSEQAHITILVKGSRSAAMEQIVHAIWEKVSC